MEFKQLEWDYVEHREYPMRKVVAMHRFMLPAWANYEKLCRLKIYEYDSHYYGLCFTATLWWFNHGIELVCDSDRLRSLTKCQFLAEQRLHELVGIFLEKPE